MPDHDPGRPQLQALAALLREVYTATDLGQIAAAVRAHVRAGVAETRRMAGTLESIEHRLTLALEDIYMAGVRPRPQNLAIAARLETAEPNYLEQLDAAARVLDRAGQSGSVLRAAAPAIAAAARDVARRRGAAFALALASELEGPGAPPCILFHVDGTPAWVNHSMTQMCEARGLARARIMYAASQFAAPLCAALLAGGLPVRLRRRERELGVLLRARVHSSERERLLSVELSEARRETGLSPRELQVARLLGRLCSYDEAAAEMRLSVDTVRTYVRRIYRKLGVSSKTQLRARLMRDGLMARE